MNRSLTVSTEMLAAEATWIGRLKPPAGAFNSAPSAVEVTTLLGAVQLRRTDFEQYREAVIPAEGAGQATITVNAAKLAAQLRKATGPAVVEITDGWLEIVMPSHTVRLRDIKAELPDWPQFKGAGEPAVVGARQLARVLTSVETSVDLPMLTVVSFDKGQMIATDRYRLTRIVYGKSGFNALVSGAVLQAFADDDNVVTIELGSLVDSPKTSMVQVSSGGRSIIAPTSDQTFPKWRQLIPDEWAVTIMAPREQLLAAVQAESVSFAINDDGTLQIRSSDGEDLEIIRDLGVTVLHGSRSEFVVKLRTKYLTEALRAVPGGQVRMSVNGPEKPVLVQDVSDGGDMHLVMPIR